MRVARSIQSLVFQTILVITVCQQDDTLAQGLPSTPKWKGQSSLTSTIADMEGTIDRTDSLLNDLKDYVPSDKQIYIPFEHLRNIGNNITKLKTELGNYDSLVQTSIATEIDDYKAEIKELQETLNKDLDNRTQFIVRQMLDALKDYDKSRDLQKSVDALTEEKKKLEAKVEGLNAIQGALSKYPKTTDIDSLLDKKPAIPGRGFRGGRFSIDAAYTRRQASPSPPREERVFFSGRSAS